LNVEIEKNMVASCQKGDKAAYAGLVEAYVGRVFAICFGMCRDRHEAQDVAQRMLLKAFMEVQSLFSSASTGVQQAKPRWGWLSGRVDNSFARPFLREAGLAFPEPVRN
jgi:hypothetical protein